MKGIAGFGKTPIRKAADYYELAGKENPVTKQVNKITSVAETLESIHEAKSVPEAIGNGLIGIGKMTPQGELLDIYVDMALESNKQDKDFWDRMNGRIADNHAPRIYKYTGPPIVFHSGQDYCGYITSIPSKRACPPAPLARDRVLRTHA